MPRNAISFILNLGKHQPLERRPLKQLNAEIETPSSLLPTPRKARKSPVKLEQAQHSNQMSS